MKGLEVLKRFFEDETTYYEVVTAGQTITWKDWVAKVHNQIVEYHKEIEEKIHAK